MKVLLMSADPAARELMALIVSSVKRRLGEPIEFLEAADGRRGFELALRERPDAVLADEIASGAGAFSLARDLRGLPEPYPGAIVVLLERKHDEWLARWSGADAWFVKPVDPFRVADRLLEVLTRGTPTSAEELKENA